MELLSRLCDYLMWPHSKWAVGVQTTPADAAVRPSRPIISHDLTPIDSSALIRRVQPESETTRSKVEAGEKYLATCSMFVCMNQSDKGRKNENQESIHCCPLVSCSR